MGKRKAKRQIEVNGIYFPTQTALKDYIREIVKQYPDEGILSDVHFSFVQSLIERHPQAETKIGAGLHKIIIRRNPIFWNNRGFHLFRIDGSDTDVSWVECLKATPHYQKVMAAMRNLIRDQIVDFKQSFFENGGDLCVLTGEFIDPSSAHVDHIAPATFQNLVLEFCKKLDINLDTIKLRDETIDNKYFDIIADDNLSCLWQEYHRQNAKLRVISQKGNLSIAKKSSRQ